MKYIYENKNVEFHHGDMMGSTLLENHFDNSILENQNYIDIKVKLSDLKLTDENIDFSDVAISVAKNQKINESIFVTKDLNIVSDNHDAIVKGIMEGLDSYIEVKMLDKDISNFLNEDYGMQGPEVTGRMGSVDLPTVSGSSELPTKDGSGDITSAGKFYNKKDIKKWLKKFETVTEAINHLDNEIVTESKNLKLDKHFDSYDELEKDKLEIWSNIPIARRAIKIDEPFSCNTLEGITQGKAGDYLVVGIDKEIYPCDAEIFLKTYQQIKL